MHVGRVAHPANLLAGAEAVARELGLTDLVAFGRPFTSNPDFVSRTRNNWPLADPDMNTSYTSGEKDFTDYPEYGSLGD
jgi:2,4-dienoyl-CoA reductase-like NADH-dependent reductase (Old Yellow Enzyme family)